MISEGSKDSEANLADITSILMADAESSRQPQEQVAENIEGEESDLDPETTEPTVLQPDISNTKPVAGPWFTFDDVPVIKRRERLHTFSAWIDLQLTREGATLSKVLKEFASRFTGTLRDWFQSLGDYRQLQFSQATHPSIVLGAIHQEFIGDASLINKMASQEYFAMKCCSLKRKDLDFHFKRMSEKFYMLNGLNDSNLKHVFLASLPQELQPEIQTMITSTRRDVTQLSLQVSSGNPMQENVYLPIQATSCEKRSQDKEEISEVLRKTTIPEKEDGSMFSLCKLHGRDLLIGFDLYHKAQKLQVLPTGLKYKRYFQPSSTIPRIFAITVAQAPYADIANKLKQYCADSHADFKHPHPLWKNPEFFIQLPFKLNEDANPIKASHPGMTPDDLVLAREECNQLLTLGLIEPTKSNWACPAFYVNKRTEQIRGKKWLVIDYKALNHCLLDDKFPLPKTKAHGFMLSDKKSFIGQPNIDFLGMKFVDGRYQPGPHITQELLKFPEENLTTKEIQQLLEENGKKHFCGHASGQFKDSEKHYHAVYKEILAIRYGIKKFEFHLIGHHFTIMMDNTSFPRIMDLKNKGVPEPQLLRLKDWFSKYQFTVKHIMGDANLFPDFLSRPSSIHLISPTGTIPIFMASSSSSTSGIPLTFPPGFFRNLTNIREYALDNMFSYLARLLSDTDIPPGRRCFRPDYPFLNVITLPGQGLPEDRLWFLWCLAALYYLPIEIRLAQMIDHLRDIKNGKSHIWLFLSWFDDIAAWNKQFQQTLDEGKSYSIIILHRPFYEGTSEARPLPLCRTWKSLEKPLIEQKHEGQELARHLCFVNKIPIPTQGLKLVYTSLAIEPMDEDSEDDPIPEPDSQDPWDYGTEINLESPTTSFYNGGPSTSA
ncbi:polyprotein [Sesamum angolense]|uniref:Polyprotein n=1 Tax=Sesamum angolense TaxID=2727404 RepID=A0AAE1T5D6_9LAMI|nr:polyprotein [Sesamum angolense]